MVAPEDSQEQQRQQQQQQQQCTSRSSLLAVPLSLLKRDGAWDTVSQEIAQRVPELATKDDIADSLRHVFVSGIRDTEVLTSLAALAVKNSRQGTLYYNQHVLTLAQYLARNSHTYSITTKATERPVDPKLLSCIGTLITSRTPLEAGWQLHEIVMEDTLRFIVDRSCAEWEYVEHSDQVLLWELRAICLMEMDALRRAMTRQISKGGDVAAAFISRQAVRIEQGLEMSTNCVTAGIERGGEKLKNVLVPEEVPVLSTNPRAKVLSLTYTDAAKRATDNVREGSRHAMLQIQAVSAKGIQTVTHTFNEKGVGERLVPDERNRTVMSAVGKVGMASIGAAALLADSLVVSTGQMTKTTAAVAAGLIEHKYGASAGQLARNSNDTIGNVLKSAAQVTLLLKSQSMTHSLAKQTTKRHVYDLSGKNLIDELLEDSRSEECDLELFDGAEGCMFDSDIALEATVEDVATKANETEKIEKNDNRVKESCSTVADSEGLVGQNNEVPQSTSKRDVLLVHSSDMEAFDTQVQLSPSELDALPDEITSIDAQCDLMSDITFDPQYESLFLSVSSHSSIFRNVIGVSPDDGGDDGVPGQKKVSKCAAECSDGDSLSLDYTVGTVEETYLTNDEEEAEEGYRPFDLEGESFVAEYSDHEDPLPLSPSEEALYLKKYREGMDDESPPRHTPMKLHQANRIPPNGYVPSDFDEDDRGEPWSRGIYSSVRSKLGL